MAIQVQSQGQIQEVVGILRKRMWQVVLPAAFVVSLGIAAAVFLPKKYTVRTTIELRPVDINQFAGVRGGDVNSYNQGFGNASFQIKHFERVRRVLEMQDWPDYITLDLNRRVEYLQRVLRNIRVIVAGGGRNLDASTFITISYTDTEPNRAEEFVNNLRDAYVQEVVERFRGLAVEERDKYQEIRKDRKAAWDRAEEQLAELKKEHGLSLTQPAPGQNARNEDPVFVALTDARNEHAQVERGLDAAIAQRETAEEQYQNEPEEIPEYITDPAVSADAEIVRLRSEIARLQAEQEGLRPPHSKYRKNEVAMDQLQEELVTMEAQGKREIREERWKPNPQKAVLYQQLQNLAQQINSLSARKERLDAELETRWAEHQGRAEIYREIAKQTNEVLLRMEAYNQVDGAYQNQANLVQMITGPEGNPFELVEPGIAPSRPTDPNPVVLILVSAVLGVGVGVGSALLAEYSRSCYRTVHDIARAMTVPVLGAVNIIVTRTEARRLRLRRLLIASSSFVIIGTILWVTWAWESRPDLLGASVLEFIDDLRAKFR